MSNDRDFIRFLLWSGMLVLAGAFSVVILVVFVDPYRIHGILEIAGFNHIKPVPDRYREEIKLTGAQSVHANAFILGNSRAEVGFDPEHPAFEKRGLSVYNLALAGTTLASSRRKFEYLRAHGKKASVIVVGLDFVDFVGGSANFVNEDNSGSHPIDGLKWKFDTVFSLYSVADAVKTLRIQNASEAETMTSRGLNPLLEYRKYAREQGYYALFRQRAVENAKTYERKRREALANDERFHEVENLRAILSEAASDGTEIYLVIYPYHAQILALFEYGDLWPAFETWKSFLVKEIELIQQAYPNSKVALWDFSGYSRFQCEAIPGANEKDRNTQWYWEAGHFKRELGNLIIARLFDSESVSDLGMQLSRKNQTANRERIANERNTCLAANPQVFQDAAQLVHDARSLQSKFHSH